MRVITYGTYDLLHYGHISLLERAKALGDYLVVGVTSDDFDKARGKINVQQSLTERMDAVKKLGIADEVIIEEYEGQKIDDIRKYDIDIFTVGSDWRGKFDYLQEFCEVIYLDRTEGISSSEIRAVKQRIRLGMVGESVSLRKFDKECGYVNGVSVDAIFSKYRDDLPQSLIRGKYIAADYQSMLETVDAVYIATSPGTHYEYVKNALEQGKHVLCDSPMTLSADQSKELFRMAHNKNLILAEGNKTAYSTAYSRLVLLVKSGKIGEVVSVDAACTSLNETYYSPHLDINDRWNSMEAWGSKCLLPVFQILGCRYEEKKIISRIIDQTRLFDIFTKIDFRYSHAVASVKVGKGIKSEGELIISGTEAYIYVPAPWWKTDYFEIRYENPADNKRYFYQLEGEGIRYEIVKFISSIESGKNNEIISREVSIAISKVMADFYQRKFELI